MNERPDEANIEDAEIATPDEGAAVAVPATFQPAPAAPMGPTGLPEAPVTDYTEAGVPTFDYVRDQIEARFATSVGMSELADDTPAGASVEEQFAAREQAGRDRLEEIRRAMRGE